MAAQLLAFAQTMEAQLEVSADYPTPFGAGEFAVFYE